ncbi:MAG TPA: DUF4019 domain-containing protein [Pyrinomonadaceae bacterium]|nr:DUF4019 domain-containing protein [Pyrinomonadaceae bacterium]
MKGRLGVRLTSMTVYLTFAFCLLAFSFACALKANRGGIPAEAQAAVDAASEDMAEGRYEEIYAEAAEEWRQASTPEESSAIFKRLKEKLGAVKSRSFHSATEQDGSNGHSFTIVYETSFERGEGMETFTVVERDRRWLLARYFVNSDALK